MSKQGSWPFGFLVGDMLISLLNSPRKREVVIITHKVQATVIWYHQTMRVLTKRVSMTKAMDMRTRYLNLGFKEITT